MAFDPFSAGLGILGMIPGMQSSQMANMISWMALQRAQQDSDRQFRFASAGREDAYGNRQQFNEALNRWETELTPTQNQITKAGEAEQLRSLTEDAQRNRQIKQTAHERGKAASKDYNTALAGFRYDQPKSEGALRDEISGLMTNAKASQGKDLQASIVRQGLRTGKGSNMASAIKAIDDQIGAEGPSTQLQARQAASGEHATRTAAHQNKYLPAMQMFAQLMDQGGEAPIRFSDTPEKLMAQQGQQASLMSDALKSGSALEQNAFGNLAKTTAAAGVPDIRGLASLIAALQGRSQRVRTTPTKTDYNQTTWGDPWF